MTPEVFLRPWKKEDAKQLAAIANNRNVWNNLRDSIPYPYTLTMQKNGLCIARNRNLC